MLRRSTSACLLPCAATLAALLTGCGADPAASPTPIPGATLTGNVHGGQQPIAGAHIFLFAANTTGSGGNGVAPSASNASVSLLKNTADTTLDNTAGAATKGDYYVTTTNSGNFTIATTDYSCTPNTQVYAYVLGGNPSYPNGSVNLSIGLLAALGNCPAADNFNTAVPFIAINELTTIAAAYAFSGYASDALHVSSSGSTLAKTGIANAFLNATNLVNPGTGAALTATPAGNGIVPQSTLNTLADILAACVNSTGASSSGCTTLFTNARSAGSAGITASDTASAAINIAHNPGANVAALYGSPTPTTPYNPTVSPQPNDFTIALTFTGGPTNQPFQPFQVAIDASGDAWLLNTQGSNVVEMSSTGAVLSGATGYTGGGLYFPQSLAIDKSGNVWVSNSGSGKGVTILSSTGVAAGPYKDGAAQNTNTDVAIDGAGNAWIANTAYQGITELSSSGNVRSGATGFAEYDTYNPPAIALDGAGSAWVTNGNGSGFNITKLSSSGAIQSPAGGYTAGGLVAPYALAFDSAGDAWTFNNYGGASSKIILELSNGGTSLSGSNGYTGGGLAAIENIVFDGADTLWILNGLPNGAGTSLVQMSSTGSILSGSNGYTSTALTADVGGVNDMAVDGSGDIWVASYSNELVYEYIGLATPVITPIAAGLPTTPTANGSSNLATRP